jgi:quercetin dioxygenase-like cupin family protein
MEGDCLHQGGSMVYNFNKTEGLQSKLSPEDWGSMEWLVDDSLVTGADMSVAVMNLLKGKISPTHRHPNSHEFIYLVEGRAEAILGEKKIILQPGDSVFIPAGTFHGTRNLGTEDVRMIISYSAGIRKYETA